MAVIAFPLLPPQGPVGPIFEWGLRSNTAVSRSSFTGATRTAERRGGPQFATLRYRNLNGSNAARLRSFLMQCRGMASRFHVPDFSYTQRGSFSAPELVANNTFTSGTSGWTSSADYAVTAADGVARATAVSAISAGGALRASSTSVCVQYAPYVGRALVSQGRGPYTAGLRLALGSTVSGTEYGVSDTVTAYGLITKAVVPHSTTIALSVDDLSNAVTQAGDFFEAAYTSVSRCALVDNGPNGFVRSDEFDNASWTKAAVTVTADNIASPTGAVIAEAIIETSATSTHELRQSVTVAAALNLDYCVAVAVKGNARTEITLSLEESAGASNASAVFNISTGAVSGETNGANWSNTRGFTRDLGNGWRYCAIVARKTNAATAILSRIMLMSVGSTSYTGNNAVDAAYVWRGTFAQSSVPVRLSLTTTAATTGTAQTGSALHLKGLPASTNGLLVVDDLVEILTPSASEMRRVSKPLNSDAAGLGYLHFEPPLVYSPADNAAVIIQRPLMRCLLDDNSVDWSAAQGVFTDLDFRVVEDVVPT